MNEESCERQLEIDSFNKLTKLGNQAVSLGLIAGHGYYQGKYEILEQGKALLMTDQEAQEYLEKLIQEIGS
ncbi:MULTISPECIES: hypothetical protein [unclassified Anabaena]|uniref:hypothetical protein n=1 Tax=unclassified Anabaena TaxID=2619674 RepID=UPI00144670E4|nr:MULTISPECIES: hypothetical protein [unclassified Anabaena]MTJ08592.1 hypothetical protein [Anabaena sp. UHCC 0204]MTJ53835.1 hypothetical protein [Anabaena sp. UHCC 0253]